MEARQNVSSAIASDKARIALVLAKYLGRTKRTAAPDAGPRTDGEAAAKEPSDASALEDLRRSAEINAAGHLLLAANRTTVVSTIAQWAVRVCRLSETTTLTKHEVGLLIGHLVEVVVEAAGHAPLPTSEVQHVVRIARPLVTPFIKVEELAEPAEPEASWEAIVASTRARCDWQATARLRSELCDRIVRVRGLLAGAHPPVDDEGLEDIRARVQEICEISANFVGEIPGDDRRAVSEIEMRDVIEVWRDTSADDPELPRTLDRVVVAAGTWAGLHAAAIGVMLFDQVRFPSWLWRGAGASDGVRRTLHLLEDPVRLEDLHRCRLWADEHIVDDDHDAFTTLEEPRDPGPPLDRLVAAWTAFVVRREEARRVGARIEALPTWLRRPHEEALRAQAGAPEGAAFIARVEEQCARLGALEALLHGDFLRQCAELIASGDADVSDVIAAAERVHSDDPEILPQVGGVRAMRKLARIPLVAPTEVAAAPGRRGVQLGHPMSRPSGGSAPPFAATLVWSELEDSAHFRVVRIPVRVTVTPPLDRPQRIALHLGGAWRSEIENNPGVLALLTDAIDLDAGSIHDVELTIPLTSTFVDAVAQRRRRLEVVVTAEPSASTVGGRAALTWTAIRDQLPEFQDPFVQSAGLAELQRFKIGVERHLDALRAGVEQGAVSFAIHGYRRFGKSSLMRSVRALANPARVAVMEPVTAAGKSPEEVWQAIARALQDRFERPVSLEGIETSLPTTEAFDPVRREAAKRGLVAVYVVIDEAQALFAQQGGAAVGERLKERLESHWGTKREGMVPLLVGLVGQMSMRRVAGANLLASLQQYRTEPIEEEELVALLRAMSREGGLESSADARKRLVQLAGNLYILQHALQALKARCRERRRCWFVRRDVEEVFDKLVLEAHDSVGSLWHYVRDPLNESIDINEWRPTEGYPVALAWARVLDEGLLFRDRERFVERVREVLGVWGEIAVSEERLKQTITELMDDHVIDAAGAFCFPLLGRVLGERARHTPQWDDAERVALERLGLRRVRCPHSSAEDAPYEGGQARVFRSVDGRAVRRIRLDHADARRRFMREVELLQKLRKACEQTGGDWSEVRRYVPLLDVAGIDERDPGCGVVIYPWIEGHPLSETSLDALALAKIGARLCLVLEKLEELGIVHADIKPSNILLRMDDGDAAAFVPALIDFGLARALDPHGTATPSLGGAVEFLPPEVLRGSNSGCWTARGDVFSLGSSLRHRLADSRGPVREILDSMAAESAEARWDARRARHAFLQVSAQLEKAQAAQEVTREVDRLFSALPGVVAGALTDSRKLLCAARLGSFPEASTRMLHAATFLEVSFEAMVNANPAVRRRLAAARRADPKLKTALATAPKFLDGEAEPWGVFADETTALVGAMRNAWAHPSDRTTILRRALGRMGLRDPARPEAERRMRDALQVVARRMDALAQGDAWGFEAIVALWAAEVVTTSAPTEVVAADPRGRRPDDKPGDHRPRSASTEHHEREEPGDAIGNLITPRKESAPGKVGNERAQERKGDAGPRVETPEGTPRAGERVRATIVSVGLMGALVDLDGVEKAVLDLRGFVARDGDEPRVGMQVDVVVQPGRALGGELVVTCDLSRAETGRAVIAKALADNQPVEGRVEGTGGDGPVVDGEGRAFRHVAEVRAKAERAAAALKVGDRVKGRVVAVNDGGIFVDLGDIEGRVLPSELSHNRRARPADVAGVGDEVEAVVWRVIVPPSVEGEASGRERARDAKRGVPASRFPEGTPTVELSRRAAMADPWIDATRRYRVGSVHRGRVARMQPFGAFIILEEGVDGLLHVSEIDGGRRGGEHPSDVLKEAQEISVRVKNIDVRAHRIGLTMVPDGVTEEQLDAEVAPRVGAIVMARITEHDSLGIWAQVEGTFSKVGRGFIMPPDSAKPRGTDLREAFPVGTDVKVKIVEIDRGRLKLSIRAALQDEERQAYRAYQQQADATTVGVSLADKLRKLNLGSR